MLQGGWLVSKVLFCNTVISLSKRIICSYVFNFSSVLFSFYCAPPKATSGQYHEMSEIVNMLAEYQSQHICQNQKLLEIVKTCMHYITVKYKVNAH